MKFVCTPAADRMIYAVEAWSLCIVGGVGLQCVSCEREYSAYSSCCLFGNWRGGEKIIVFMFAIYMTVHCH